MARREIRLETEDQESRRIADKSYDLQPPTDTEMLDWLENNTKGYGNGWICRDSLTGRGLRLHETNMVSAKRTVRMAILDAMRKEI